MRVHAPRLLAFTAALVASASAVPTRLHAQITPAPNRTVPNGVRTLATPASYPLVCRGTPGLNVMVRPVRVGLLIFERSSGPATAGLAPGQCAWMDRAVNASEPNHIAQRVPEGADREAPYIWPEVLRSADRYWRFDVYNNRHGDLVVTKSAETSKP